MRVGRTVVLTDTGRRRRRNEDAHVVRPPLFAVADGMGGAQAGELASKIAADAMSAWTDGTGEERVTALIQEANRRVYERSSEDAAASGMGTTMTAALVADDGRVAIGHVGDSRAYLLREAQLDQLTEDHSLVAELVRTGKLSVEEAETHPQRSMITRALGTDPDVDVDTFSIQARPGDLFLLCSDGLTTMVADAEILRTIEDHRSDLDAAAKSLVKKANKGGGEDNITVLFFEIAEDAVGDETARLPVAEEPDADTLDELDAVPVVDTTRAELDRTARRVLAILAVLALIAVAVTVLVLGLLR
jgi:protein phosphatase